MEKATAAPFAAANLISGPTGSGKTSLVETMIEYVWERFGRTTLYYSSDPGGFTERLQGMIILGIARVWRVQTRGEAFETLARATSGWWPASIDAMSGVCAPNADLIPPTLNEFTMSCPKDGTVIRRVQLQNLLVPGQCRTCKAMVNLRDARVEKTVAPSPTFNPPGRPQVGAVAFDGLTSMSDWLMLDMADRTARGELVGEKTALGGKVRSGMLDFGSNNRAHYGFAQVMVEKFLKNSISIPGLVVPPLWTSLESRVDETGTELAEYGPAIAGQAKTRKVPQWVGNYLGAVIMTDKGGERHYRLYTTEYRGEDGIAHRYKTRSEPGTLRDYYEDGPTEKPFTTFSMGRVMSDMEEGLGSTVERLRARFKDAPGIGPQANLQASDAHTVVVDHTYIAPESEGVTDDRDRISHQAISASAGNVDSGERGPGGTVPRGPVVGPPGAPHATPVRNPPVGGSRLPVAIAAAPSIRRPGGSPAPATIGARVFTPPNSTPATPATPATPKGGTHEDVPAAVAAGAAGADHHDAGRATASATMTGTGSMKAPGAPPAAPRPPKKAAVEAPKDASDAGRK